MVLRPLAATSRAARQIAVGDLDVQVPTRACEKSRRSARRSGRWARRCAVRLRRQAAIEQERRIFIGAIVHDLRTPLFSLRGYLEGLAEGVADTPEKRSRYVAVAQEKALALERLVADLFDYTRLEYLEQAPNPQPTRTRRRFCCALSKGCVRVPKPKGSRWSYRPRRYPASSRPTSIC